MTDFATKKHPIYVPSPGALHINVKLFWFSTLMLVVAQYAIAPYSFSVTILLQRVLYPVLIAAPLCIALTALGSQRGAIPALTPYALFFSISALSGLHLAKPIDGAFSTSTIPMIYGLPFYTAAVAFWYRKGEISRLSPLIVANPLLLITGPIPIRFMHHNSSIVRRITYFGPYMIVGFFFFKVVAGPLAYGRNLIDLTDALSVLVFALVFELFVYFNFAGLSLLVFGVLGILGLRIPLNFRQPFSSRNLVDFWRGWHTSLSAVLKCLFYEPTKVRFGTYTAVLCVFLASAAWHGMTWNFLIWGLLHGFCYILTIALLRSGSKIFTTVLLATAIILGRLIFADSDINRLIEKLSVNLEAPDFFIFTSAPKTFFISLTLAFALVGVEFACRANRWVSRRNYKHLRAWFPLTSIVILIAILTENTGLDFAVYGQR